jgi:hypothetical protein
MTVASKSKEALMTRLRLLVALIGGGLMLCFTTFTTLTVLTDGLTVVVLILGVGLLIGMMSHEVQWAMVIAIAAFFLGIVFYIIAILIPVYLFGSLALGDVLVLFGLFAVLRVIHLQIFGLFIGAFLGRVIGPDWYSVGVVARHQLRPTRKERVEEPE